MILYGAGGHARVVFESLASSGEKVNGIIDDDPRIEFFNGAAVVHSYNKHHLNDEKLVISIGSNRARFQLASRIEHTFGVVIDHSCFISPSSQIGGGSMVLARAMVQTGCMIGDHVIVNSGAILEHDCVIGDFVHIGPGSVVCGGVEISSGALIGANATLLPGVKIGDWATVGAGSVVLNDVPQGATVAGSPAKIIS